MAILVDDEEKARPRKVKVKNGSAEERAFAESRKGEISGRLRDITLLQMREKDIDREPRIFESRFVDEMKRVGERLRKKSRLVVQNYANERAATSTTTTPTVQLFSEQICCSGSQADVCHFRVHFAPISSLLLLRVPSRRPPLSCTSHPSRGLQSPPYSSVVRCASSVVRSPSSVVCRPSSVVRRPSSVVHDVTI